MKPDCPLVVGCSTIDLDCTWANWNRKDTLERIISWIPNYRVYCLYQFCLNKLFEAIKTEWNITINGWTLLIIGGNSAPLPSHQCTDSQSIDNTRWQQSRVQKLLYFCTMEASRNALFIFILCQWSRNTVGPMLRITLNLISKSSAVACKKNTSLNIPLSLWVNRLWFHS